MNKDTLTALKGSIKKWERIRNGTGQDLSTANCSLCKLFFYPDCGGCPVKMSTRRRDCRGTPYEDWAYEFGYGRHRSKRAKELAQKELDFLRSLLPKRKK